MLSIAPPSGRNDCGYRFISCGQARLVILLAAALMSWFGTGPAYAQSKNTYVSGNGDDSNPCTAALPCLTLQGALAKTAAGGQISTLNSANYGYVTINKAISIVNGRGATGVLATSGVSGITIGAGSNDSVNLRGLDIDGAGSGAAGIRFNSGASLQIRDSVVRNFTTGIVFQPSGSSTLLVENTVLSGNATGLVFQGTLPIAGALNEVQIVNNQNGIFASGASSAAIARISVRNSLVANNSQIGILSNGFSVITVTETTVANNGVGAQAQNAGAFIELSGSTVVGNATGWMIANGGQVTSSSNNAIGGNTTGNSAPPTTTTQTPPPPPVVSFLKDDTGGYILDSNGGKITAS